MYALCVSGAVIRKVLCGRFFIFIFYALYVNFHSFIHKDRLAHRFLVVFLLVFFYFILCVWLYCFVLFLFVCF